jgi:hypothetical protein
MSAANHGQALDVAAIGDALRSSMLATEQLALALKEGSTIGAKLAAGEISKHANRVRVLSDLVGERIATNANRHPHTNSPRG